MLSILIPVYEESVVRLITELVRQGQALNLSFEIIVLDDGSSEEIKKGNERIREMAEVNYESLPRNIGRSAIRNLMGVRAKFSYLLFLDGDSYPEHSDFLKKYVDQLEPATVLVGGTAYAESSPSGKELHWLVGSQREVVSAVRRSRDPYHGFSSFNFLVPKNIFQKIKFDDSITEYGHEDTLFGWSLKRAGIAIVHLENRLIHLGLDDAPDFLNKREVAIRNLLVLREKYDMMDTRLLRTYTKLSSLKLLGFVIGLFGVFENTILRNLESENPRLIFFFWWSLATLDRHKKR